MDGFLPVALYILLQASLGDTGHLAYFSTPCTMFEARTTCSQCGGHLVNWDGRISEAVSRNNLQNKTMWIGNYSSEIPRFVKKGCVEESSEYKVIRNNNLEFCKRTCSMNSVFAIRGMKCFCFYKGYYDLVECSKPSALEIYDTDVYFCDFENTPCLNASYGNEMESIVWRKMEDTEDTEIDDTGKRGHYLMLYSSANTGKIEEAIFLLSLHLPNTFFCLSFYYYMYFSGSLQVKATKKDGSSYLLWNSSGNKGKTWLSATMDVKGHEFLVIEIQGSVENNYINNYLSRIAIDDIKIQQGSCNTAKDMDCYFDDGICKWSQDTNWELKQAENSYPDQNENQGNFYVQNGDKKLEMLSSLSISTSVTSEFCLQFYYKVFDYERDRRKWILRARLMESRSNRYRDIFIIDGDKNKNWTPINKNVSENENFSILISTWMPSGYIGLDAVILSPGSCDQVDSSAWKNPMCATMNAEDNERISVAFCSTMKQQTFLCEIDKQPQPMADICNKAQLLDNTESTVEGKSSEIPITSSGTSQTPLENTTDITESVFEITTGNNNTSGVNLPSLSGIHQGKYNLGLSIAVGVLSFLVIVLLIFVICLLLNSKRKNGKFIEKNNFNNSLPAAANGEYEMQSITDHKQASTTAPAVNKKPKQLTDAANVTHTDGYQIVDTKDQKHESLVYQDMNEGEYDHMGGSRDRKLDLNNTGDPTYDHAQSVKPRVDDTYDTTKVQTDFNYFKLEPENNSKDGSAIYDHTT